MLVLTFPAPTFLWNVSVLSHRISALSALARAGITVHVKCSHLARPLYTLPYHHYREVLPVGFGLKGMLDTYYRLRPLWSGFWMLCIPEGRCVSARVLCVLALCLMSMCLTASQSGLWPKESRFWSHPAVGGQGAGGHQGLEAAPFSTVSRSSSNFFIFLSC